MKTVLRRSIVLNNCELLLCNITAVSIANYGANEVIFSIDGIASVLPPWDATNKVPTFTYGVAPGTGFFDFKADFDFNGLDSTVIVDFTQIKDQ
ncbi:MAG: hypothetical protein RLZ77_1434 [Bacteroidota bacterium]|jgi:hypothetical protein